eukprot:maker-scaffold168_size293125-snap-gene-1.74 protein:Tk04475 transcript:maker-scaffold168_size293125-snap-gene-1.74-mRNA-1 annotation:"hypothetical protein KGM_08614"
MPRYGQVVLGPAGSGKSHYCSRLVESVNVRGRSMHVVNLDPAAEHFDYAPLADIRDLIQLDDVMEDGELKFGPNGGLVFCLEFLLENISWLEDILTEVEDDYILFDCPGQIELYTHLPLDTFLNLDLRELQNMGNPGRNPKYARLTEALARVLEDYSLIQFFPLDLSHETSLDDLLHVIDNTIQYGEEEDVKAADFNDEDPEESDAVPGDLI